MTRLRSLACLALFLAVPPAFAERTSGDGPEVAGSTAAAPATPTFPAPTEATVAASWQDFLERGTIEAVSALEVVHSVVDEEGEVDAARCSEHRPGLEHATAVAPVSTAAWYFAHLCAQAIGDDTWAAQALAAFGALSRHALLSTGANEWDPPIRVVALIDVDAFLLASGQDVLYRYLDVGSLPRWFAMRVALRDSANGPLQRLRFDFLDTILRLTREPGWDTPGVRRVVARQWLQDSEGDEMLLDTMKVMEALGKASVDERWATMRAAARDGGLLATNYYAAYCLDGEQPCADEAVDLLLPLAELRVPDAMSMLALANALGRGTRKDEKAAKALLDATSARIGAGDAYASFAFHWIGAGGTGKLPRWARKELLANAREGSSAAAVAFAIAGDSGRDRLTKEAVALLESDLAQRRSPAAAYLLALRAIDEHAPDARVVELLRIAAEAGYPASFALLASIMERGAEGSPEEARRWRLEAARAGDLESMRRVGDWFAEGAPPRDARLAQVWYANAVARHDDVATLRLAKLLLTRAEGLVGGLEDAGRMLRELAERGEPEARRLYADMLVLGRGVERDTAAAEKLIRAGAAAGDGEARTLLGVWLVDGDLGPDRVAEGLAELETAADGGNGHALTALAAMHYWAQGVKRDERAALRYWERAVATGYRPAYNTLAWHLCTAESPGFLDGRKGLETMAALESLMDLRYDARDTVAACHAAAGDFDRAVEQQQGAIELARNVGVPAAEIEEMQERQRMFARRERVVTRESPFSRRDAGDAPPAATATTPAR